MTDEQLAQAERLIAALLELGATPPMMPAPVEALHERWAARSLGNSLTIEGPSHPDGWMVSLVSAGWPSAKSHTFESPNLGTAVRQAMRWLDEVHND